jgi:hypothetical protein
MTEPTIPIRLEFRAMVGGMTLAVCSAYVVLLAIDAETVNRLGREDGPIETAGAVFFLVAAAGFLAAFVFSARRHVDCTDTLSRRAAAFALLALLMFVCFGEELSWGQRIFGWRTPPIFAGLNAQNETNLHNIQAVHQWNPDGSEKGFFGKLIKMNRLFSVFWLVVFVIFPLAVLSSNRLRCWVEMARCPVPPLWAGSLFLVSYLVYKALAFVQKDTLRAHALDELKETSYAAIYAFIAAAVLATESRRTQNPESGLS